jgi:hypothetical protein
LTERGRVDPAALAEALTRIPCWCRSWRTDIFHTARPASQTASQSVQDPAIIWIHPPTSFTLPAGLSGGQRSLTRKKSPEPKRDSGGDSNAVTSAAVHSASFAPLQAHERPLRVLRWLLLISGRVVTFGKNGMTERVGDEEPSRRIRDLWSSRQLACGRDRPAVSHATGRTRRRDG